MKALALVVACLAIGGWAGIDEWAPQQPHWPDTWKASWNEELAFTGVKRFTGGEGFYDLPNGHLLWARTNGAADPVCNISIPLPYDTPCTHVISSGNHYLYTQNLNSCCLCCTEEQGCGMPASDGLANFTFGGKFEYLGKDVYQWTQVYNGFTVAYLETTEPNPVDRSWAALFSPFDNYTNIWSFESPADPAEFQLPSSCSGAALCPSGPCAYLRNQEPTRLRHAHPNMKLFPLI